MTSVLQVLGVSCMVLGGLVFAVGAFGLLRLPDFYSRLSGVSIAAGLGTALLLLGLLLHFPSVENALKLGLALLIQLATAAVGGNAMARAGYLVGTPTTPSTRYDDLAVDTVAARKSKRGGSRNGR
ncbi:multicomponent Na+:H+ antiporter subunit G [Actinoalloteichus hoggarensis]|uniref:Na(+)/H(+) antiporter subunit G1 n=1 Tax=Actinoalloteichus hoggarensis TaxID=1470176 RepID=A0A221W6T2_9PSEU|nr:monovalent cation/H(+) antiporter subunit G [Actinoalloteichus hoggarensis]ASO21642.1 Na(+)/H(+) antiporter subunit G1 [Actinoalloteichus hoggarensis]MBB5922235.1 multicomponent Na+:H+ antiporter subunit G [Actinoalloteichus hoggarensis]